MPGNCFIPTRLSAKSIFVSLVFIATLVFTYSYVLSKEAHLIEFGHPIYLFPEKIKTTDRFCFCPIGIELFPKLNEKFKVPRRNDSHLPRKLLKEDYDTFMRLLKFSLRVFEDNDIAYTVSAGTLVGSYVRLGNRMIDDC